MVETNQEMDRTAQVECPHNDAEKQIAVADGVCPLCLLSECRQHDNSFRMACVSIATLTEQRGKLTNALNTALALQDAMLTELRALCKDTPPHQIIQITVAKKNFDEAMKRLLDPLADLR